MTTSREHGDVDAFEEMYLESIKCIWGYMEASRDWTSRPSDIYRATKIMHRSVKRNVKDVKGAAHRAWDMKIRIVDIRIISHFMSINKLKHET